MLHFPETPEKLTTADATLGTFNAVLLKIRAMASENENNEIDKIIATIKNKEKQMDEYHKKHGCYIEEDQQELANLVDARDSWIVDRQRAFDVRVPMSRTEVDTTPLDGFGGPVNIANMLRATGKRMAEGAARAESFAMYPQGKSTRNVNDFFRYMHSRDPQNLTPVTVRPTHIVRDALYFLAKRPLGHAVVTDSRNRIVGIISQQELEEAAILDQELEVGSILRKKNVVEAREGDSIDAMIQIMKETHVDFIPIVTNMHSARKQLKWVMTRQAAEQQKDLKPNLDEKGRLATVLAISAQRKGWQKRVDHALKKEVTAIVLDSPRFDLGYEEWLDRVEYAATRIIESGRPVRLIVGNVDNPEIVKGIITKAIKCGMNPNHVVVKIGIGPGNACTTRVVSGIGEPQLSVVHECALAARRLGGHVYADGGIREPGDVVKYLAAGATQATLGTIAAPLIESPATLHTDENGIYAVNFGMASEIFAQLRTDIERNGDSARYRGGFVEGLGAQKVYRQKNIHTVSDLMLHFRRGVQGGFAMLGAFNTAEAQHHARFGLQNPSGHHEGLGKTVVK